MGACGWGVLGASLPSAVCDVAEPSPSTGGANGREISAACLVFSVLQRVLSPRRGEWETRSPSLAPLVSPHTWELAAAHLGQLISVPHLGISFGVGLQLQC